MVVCYLLVANWTNNYFITYAWFSAAVLQALNESRLCRWLGNVGYIGGEKLVKQGNLLEGAYI